MGTRPRRGRRAGHRHLARQRLALPAAENTDAHARRARVCAPSSRACCWCPSSASSSRPSRCWRPSRSSGFTTSKWHRARRCRSNPSGCATRCCRPCRTTCARRWPRLYGLADTLIAEVRRRCCRRPLETARAIGAEARRMNAMVNNLLDMARLQSGAVQLNREWQPIEEVVGTALQSVGAALAWAHGAYRARAGPAAGQHRRRADRARAVRTCWRTPASTHRLGQHRDDRRARHRPPICSRSPSPTTARACRRRARGSAVREVHARRARVGDAGRGLGAGDLPSDRRGARGAHLGRVGRPADAAARHALRASPCRWVHPPSLPKTMRETWCLPRNCIHFDMSEPHPPVVIVIEDDPQIRRFVRHCAGIRRTATPSKRIPSNSGLIEAGTRKPDLVVLDLGLPDGDGLDLTSVTCAHWSDRSL